MNLAVVVATFMFVLWGSSGPALAHGDEDHGAAADAAAPAATIAPAAGDPAARRTAVASEDFEAVLVRQGDRLLVYLDRFASNEPVMGATVTVEGERLNARAQESSPGVYVVDIPPTATDNRSLTLLVDAGDAADLLPVTLAQTPATSTAPHVHGWREWLIWLGAGGVLALAGILLRRRQRAQRRKA